MAAVTEIFGAHVPGIQLDQRSLDAALELSGLTSDELLVELGSGEGRGLVRAATRYGAQARGVELMPHAVDLARKRAEQMGVAERVSVQHGDLMQHPVSDADVVLVYLGPAFYGLLAPKLERELKDGARVVTLGWQVHGWELRGSRDDAPIQSFCYQPVDARDQPTGAAFEVTTSALDGTTVRVELTDIWSGPERGTRRWITTPRVNAPDSR